MGVEGWVGVEEGEEGAHFYLFFQKCGVWWVLVGGWVVGWW